MSNIKDIIIEESNNRFSNNSMLIEKLISPAVGIKLKDKGIDTLDAHDHLLSSKIGGLPDIEHDFAWPSINNVPLTFLCQIDLAKAGQLYPDLQTDGVLYFFINNVEPSDYSQYENGFHIIYSESNRIKRKLPIETLPTIEEYFIEFCEYYTLPSYQEKIINESHYLSSISDDLDDFYDYILELTLGEEKSFRHHLFGDPDAVQGSVRPFWGAKILKPQDVFYEGLMAYYKPAEEIGNNFILLLQLDLADARIQLHTYGDSCLYFGILKEDLKNRNFANVKLVIQNT